VDPSTLCPYCDEPWPSSPSPTLLALLDVSKRKSYKEPRPGNPLGLTAPFSIFVEICQRHRFEMTHLPLALQRGWPTHLDFPSLPKRILGFKKALARLIVKPQHSKFWRDLRDDVKEVGRTKMVSVSGQYATFERTQPGYYGEQGSIIIHQTLYYLFPPELILEESVLPLTPDQFITHVLVPETAVLLIKSDMGLSSKADALEVMEESKKYGIAMFP
ncbi:RTC4-like domain-containing protein, partial [Hysterangium stoloniferum]